MAWSITLDFQDGGGARDVTEYVLKQSFRREWQWANGLSPASSQLRFAIQSNATIANLFLAATSTEVLVTVTKDGSGYFRGIVQNKFDVAVSTRLAPVEVMCVDRGELLRRKITSTFAWVGREVCTPDATDTSIVHQLLTLAGFASGDWNITEEIADEIAYFVVIASDDKTYWEILEELLGEFGYAFWFDADGDFRLGELAPATATSTQTFDETIVSGVLAASKRQQSYEAVEVEWAPNLSLANQVVFSDTTGGTEANKAYIPVAAGDWYPESVETYDVFSEYRIDGREVIYCASPSIDWSGETGLSLDTFTNYYRRALIKIQNTAGAEKHITKLDVVGTVVVRGDPSFTKVEFVTNSEKIEKITARWITTQAQATFLASLRSRFYEYGHIEYRWQSRTLVTPGAIVTLRDPILGMDNLVRVQNRSDNEVTGIATYTGYGLAAYTAETPDTSGIHTTPGTRTVDDRVDGLPTFDDLEEGWDASGGSGTNGTQTPSVPTVTAHGLYKAIVIEWDRQTYLTNFARYEVQVSDDAGTTWYSLDFDGDGVGTAAADTDCVVERLTHSRIPFGGTEDAPTGTTYHYRVRRVTRAAVASDWSDAASATTLTIDTGDIAENSITTNKLVTGLLNTMVAEVLSYLEVSDTLGWLAGAYTTPVSGNQRAYLDKNEFRLQIHNGATWLDRFVVSASDGTDDYTATLTACALSLIPKAATVPLLVDRVSGYASIKGYNSTYGKALILDGYAEDDGIVGLQYNLVGDVVLCYGAGTGGGTVGIGTTDIEAWSATYAVIEFGSTAIMANRSTGRDLYLISNAYRDAGAWRYKTTEQACVLYIYGTEERMTFTTVSSGTADNAITFIDQFDVVGNGTGALNVNFGGAASGNNNRDVYLNVATDSYILWDESESRLDFYIAGQTEAAIMLQHLYLGGAAGGSDRSFIINFASDASFEWNESLSIFSASHKIMATTDGTRVFAASLVTASNFNENTVYDTFAIQVPSTSDLHAVHGWLVRSGVFYVVFMISRVDSDTLRLHVFAADSATGGGTLDCDNGDTTVVGSSCAIYV